MDAVANGKLDSYGQGTSSVPLLGETISQNLRRTVQTYGSRDALVALDDHKSIASPFLSCQAKSCDVHVVLGKNARDTGD